MTPVFIVGIHNGQMYLREGTKQYGEFAPTDVDKLAEVIRGIGKDIWLNSHVMSSSSMDFPKDDGWPDEQAHEFFHQAVEKAFAERRPSFRVGHADWCDIIEFDNPTRPCTCGRIKRKIS